MICALSGLSPRRHLGRPDALQRCSRDGLSTMAPGGGIFPRPAPPPPQVPRVGLLPTYVPQMDIEPLTALPRTHPPPPTWCWCLRRRPRRNITHLSDRSSQLRRPPPSPVAPCPVNVPRKPPPVPPPRIRPRTLTTHLPPTSRRRHTPPHLPPTSCCTNGVRSTKIATKLEHTRALRNEVEVGWGWVRVVRHATQRCPAFTETLPMLTSNMFL
jgi:hypothetical protein